MFKIEYRGSAPGAKWLNHMTVARLIDVVNEKRRLISQGFEVRVLNSVGDVI